MYWEALDEVGLTLPSQLVLQFTPSAPIHIPCTCGSPYTVYMWIPIYRVHADPHIPCTCGSPYTVYMRIPIYRVHADPHIPCTCGSPYTVYMWIPIYRVHVDPHIPCTCGSPYTMYMWIPIYRVHVDPHIENPMGSVLHGDVQFRELKLRCTCMYGWKRVRSEGCSTLVDIVDPIHSRKQEGVCVC